MRAGRGGERVEAVAAHRGAQGGGMGDRAMDGDGAERGEAGGGPRRRWSPHP